VADFLIVVVVSLRSKKGTFVGGWTILGPLEGVTRGEEATIAIGLNNGEGGASRSLELLR
jgi:hypothetical protein